jgi:hypothetical protein
MEPTSPHGPAPPRANSPQEDLHAKGKQGPKVTRVTAILPDGTTLTGCTNTHERAYFKLHYSEGCPDAHFKVPPARTDDRVEKFVRDAVTQLQPTTLFK